MSLAALIIGWLITLAVIGAGATRIVGAIHQEGAATRALLVKFLTDGGPFADGEPSLARRIMWIQWKVNPRPED